MNLMRSVPVAESINDPTGFAVTHAVLPLAKTGVYE